eukprot:CAMPEP_0174859320 /NCGR_PEP_ID=MMETSP1114-20130205/46062_1 /TAXON_ID=312471 /ORGANISM="Neobodo designis, Strain CCAP 1951/1" /LENGTH=32 /DNA_ID= /DNA_START= /DNA_END= /DNA_ORIENTATION=
MTESPVVVQNRVSPSTKTAAWLGRYSKTDAHS